MTQRVPSWDLEDAVARPHPAPDYEVAELTWENGQLSMHGLGLPRHSTKPGLKQCGAAAGTLESIVKLATAGAARDALVPCETAVGSCSGHVPTADPTSTSLCSQGNTLGSDSVCHSRPHVCINDEVERKRKAKSSSSTRRSRAAAVHNQSERKRRDKINQKMKMLQKLVPNSNKTDKASMLDEVIDYLKQLQAQVHMISRMSVPPMMMPQLAMQQQQQLQMSMMAAAAGMGMGMAPMPAVDMNMSMGMGININSMAACQNPMAAFMPPWDVSLDARLPSQAAVVPTDPISAYLACQPQPMAVETYSRMIALIQQQQQHLASISNKR